MEVRARWTIEYAACVWRCCRGEGTEDDKVVVSENDLRMNVPAGRSFGEFYDALRGQGVQLYDEADELVD